MNDHVETLVDLDRKERVHVETDTDTDLEMLVNQRDYEDGDHLRLELVVEDDDGRYQIRSFHEEGGWTTPELRRMDHGADFWSSMGEVVALEPLGDTRAMDSTDDSQREG